MQIKGTIKRIFQAQQITDSFKNRKLWVVTTDQYPQTFEIEFTNDKTSLLDKFTEGQTVTVDVNLRGRHWSKNDKEGVMVSLQGWKITEDVPAADVIEDETDDIF